MKPLHTPDNIKVHFASCESLSYFTALKAMGVNYGLYSAYPFVRKKILGKRYEEDSLSIPRILYDSMAHVIQDSGLFSLLYGSAKHLATKSNIFKWYDGLIEYTLQHGQKVTCVEVDCQDILGSDIAWDLRERMRADLPNNRIINVFHLSDGVKGLDRLIEYSDYIGIGSGDPNNSSYTMYEVASYIKNKKPSIDIHLLGCTHLKTIKKCNFCTSCDSITWLNPIRFGTIRGTHVSGLDTVKVQTFFGIDTWNSVKSITNEARTNTLCAGIESFKRQYEIYAGNQDYTKYF